MDLKNRYFPVLDHGFIALKDTMGDDSSIVEAARVSYGKGTKSITDDNNLIRYLLRHKHTTPFEMVEFKFHIAMPIHVHRQFVRHRTASMNEYSARYSVVPEVTYESQVWAEQSKDNRQGRAKELWTEDVQLFSDEVHVMHLDAFKLYNQMLSRDISREQARMHLPLNTYTYFYWKIDLHNLLHLMRLRSDSHAQQEIRQYSNMLAGMVKEVCPAAFGAWYDYVYGAVNFTRLDRKLLNSIIGTYSGHGDSMTEMLSAYDEDQNDEHVRIGMGKREFAEFRQKVMIPDEHDFTLDVSKSLTSDEILQKYSVPNS